MRATELGRAVSEALSRVSWVLLIVSLAAGCSSGAQVRDRRLQENQGFWVVVNHPGWWVGRPLTELVSRAGKPRWWSTDGRACHSRLPIPGTGVRAVYYLTFGDSALVHFAVDANGNVTGVDRSGGRTYPFYDVDTAADDSILMR